jgi:hypothetical protein
MVLNPQRLNLPGALRVEITHALSARFEFQIKTRPRISSRRRPGEGEVGV